MELIIYHAEGRRSERIVWLCEELGLPYTLKFKRGDLGGTLGDIRAVSPLMTVAPVVQIDGQVMVESGAILELILARYGDGRMAPPVESKDFPYYLQWLHFAEGSAASRVVIDYRVGQLTGNKVHKLATVLDLAGIDDLYLRLVSTWPDPARIVVGGHELPIPTTAGQHAAPEAAQL